jgi:predicted ATP-dependent endonuclease of OLD family
MVARFGTRCVFEAFFARNVVLVESDSELAVLVRQDDIFKIAGVDLAVVRDTTVVSCGAEWTIVPIARLLTAFGVQVRVIHDVDRKGKTDADLATDEKHEFHANQRILDVVGDGKCLAIEDTFEDVLSTAANPFSSSKDMPYRASCRIRELCEGRADLNHAPRLKSVLEFAYRPFA